MDYKDLEGLCLIGDMSNIACSIRLIAAREATGLSQAEVSAATGIGTNAINNMERARQYPNRTMMQFLFRRHRIDFTFIIHGDYAQLPGDVQNRIFAALPAAHSAMGQKPN
jgi:transcriptional regulator with XRE-family HTH domain